MQENVNYVATKSVDNLRSEIIKNEEIWRQIDQDNKFKWLDHKRRSRTTQEKHIGRQFIKKEHNA